MPETFTPRYLHEAVKNALVKDGRTITHDPLRLRLRRGKSLWAWERSGCWRRNAEQSGSLSRLRRSLIHIDISEGKLWIQQDGTQEGVAGELVAAGVPKDRIVLAFRAPSLRAQLEFAVA